MMKLFICFPDMMTLKCLFEAGSNLASDIFVLYLVTQGLILQND